MKKDKQSLSPEARAIIRAQLTRRTLFAGVGAVSAAGLLAAAAAAGCQQLLLLLPGGAAAGRPISPGAGAGLGQSMVASRSQTGDRAENNGTGARQRLPQHTQRLYSKPQRMQTSAAARGRERTLTGINRGTAQTGRF